MCKNNCEGCPCRTERELPVAPNNEAVTETNPAVTEQAAETQAAVQAATAEKPE